MFCKDVKSKFLCGDKYLKPFKICLMLLDIFLAWKKYFQDYNRRDSYDHQLLKLDYNIFLPNQSPQFPQILDHKAYERKNSIDLKK